MKTKPIILIFLLFTGYLAKAQKDVYLFPANSGKEGKAGFIDSTGKVVIPYLYDEVLGFSDGLAAVRIGEKWGYIDKSGKVAIPAQFVYAYPFEYGVAQVYYQDKTQFLNKNGNLFNVDCEDYELFSEGMIKIKKDGLYGFADYAGKTVIKAEYDKVFDFKEGTGYAQKDGIWYFFDKQGKILFQTNNNPVGRFSEGLIQVKNGEKYGFMDKTGKLVIPQTLQFRNNTENYFSDGLAVIQEGAGYYDYKMGCIDKNGKIVIKPTFTLIYNFKEGMASYYSENKDGYIDKTGKIVVTAQYENAFEFSEGYAIAIRGLGGGKFQYEILNKKGQVIKTIDAYEGIRESTKFNHGLCKLHQTIAANPNMKDENMRQWGGVKTIYVNTKGEIVWESEPWYSCFPNNAKVLMADFTEKSIDKIIAGEEVLTVNKESQKLEKSIVAEIPQHIGNYQLIEISYANCSGLTATSINNISNSINTIKLTENHPIMTDNGNIPAGKLKVGDEIFTYNPLSKQIEKTRIERIERCYKPVNKVYNLKIKGDNYFVDGVLVKMK